MHEVLVGVLIWCGITIGMVSHLCKLKDDAYSDDLPVFSSYLVKGYKVTDSLSDRYYYTKLSKIVQTEIETVYYLLSHPGVRKYTSNKREKIPKKDKKPGVYVDDTAYKRLENLRKRYGITIDKIKGYDIDA